MPKAAPLAPQIEQFIHDNPQGVLTSFRRNGMPQLSIVTVYPRDGGVGIGGGQARRDDSAARSRVRLGAGPHARGGGEVD